MAALTSVACREGNSKHTIIRQSAISTNYVLNKYVAQNVAN